MPCKWDHEPCLKQGCSEWDCAGLKTPEECKHWEPLAKPTLTIHYPDGTETTVTPAPMWQP